MGKPAAEFCLRCFFLSPVFRRKAGSSLTRPLSPSCRAELDAAGCWVPPSRGPAAALPGQPSAAMAPEMEPLFLAWSYFRRRKFQLCAALCTQMLEKSPYDQVPASPHRPCGSWGRGTGTRGCPGLRVGAPGRKAQRQVDCVVSTDPGSRVRRAPARCVPEARTDPRLLCQDNPASNVGGALTSSKRPRKEPLSP